ncbi:tectonic-3 isoform X2 [Sturnira hondurensis]|uniref:tectonic-3 isoform X2 n=1 Tax=Sturnira hondurensis TaxID=192404 RepID=UPI00187A3AEE|nr:tectonic-3 isoform X2 [Sturnira hondurensis]
MCTSSLVLLQVFFLMIPEGIRPQPSSSPSGAVSTSSDLGPGVQGGTLRSSSEGTGTPRAVPGISAVGPTVLTPSTPENGTMDLFPALPICVCDLTPGTCDINCCCDRDCYLIHPRTVFSFCLLGSVRSSSWVCVDNSLIFRSNSPFPSRIFVDLNGIRQFCVHVNNCFLESKSTTCVRFFKNLAKSCTLDPALNAASYYNFTVLKVPRGMTDLQNMKFQVPVTPVSQAGSPLLAGNACQNVVSQVTYEIETNGTSGIQKVSVSFGQANLSVEPGASLQQHFVIRFRASQSTAASFPAPRSGNPGYIVGKPLLALTSEVRQSMTLLQSQGDGTCSVRRHDVQFGVNAMSGCKLRLEKMGCSHLQRAMYQTLHGGPRPEHVAVFGDANPAQKGQWARILSRNCSVAAIHCASCCVLPVSLEIQVLWAYIGLQSNPQAHVSGARFLYQCQSVKDSKVTEMSLTTIVTFVDITQKPEPPRGQPRIDWKLPFDFFFPFKVAFSKGVHSQKDSVCPILILCFLLLGVLSLETK